MSLVIRNLQRAIPIRRVPLRRNVEIVRNILGVEKFDLGIICLDNKNIQHINGIYRKKNVPTDVLSFPFHEDLKAGEIPQPGFPDDYNLGDIFLGVEYIFQQCKENEDYCDILTKDPRQRPKMEGLAAYRPGASRSHTRGLRGQDTIGHQPRGQTESTKARVPKIFSRLEGTFECLFLQCPVPGPLKQDLEASRLSLLLETQIHLGFQQSLTDRPPWHSLSPKQSRLCLETGLPSPATDLSRASSQNQSRGYDQLGLCPPMYPSKAGSSPSSVSVQSLSDLGPFSCSQYGVPVTFSFPSQLKGFPMSSYFLAWFSISVISHPPTPPQCDITWRTGNLGVARTWGGVAGDLGVSPGCGDYPEFQVSPRGTGPSPGA
ncbi:putative ribonuclease isoform X3 [Heterocephalus glaber]|nr:putative ribonuclease isoform X3 [Heterocephalus glaber]XP_021112098.1 putative ribonuclease isoform X3 [Heterocephalus glaber]XP_021112099.1 putative ribonuclease isoform X3 [Heterocephalus glaber]